MANDLTVVGSLAGGGALGNVDLVYVPEPSAVMLTVMGFLAMFALGQQRRDQQKSVTHFVFDNGTERA